MKVTDQKEMNKTISICRWYVGLHRKLQGIYKKISWTNKWVHSGRKTHNTQESTTFL